MELPPNEGDPQPPLPPHLHHQLIFSEAQLAESLGDPHHQQVIIDDGEVPQDIQQEVELHDPMDESLMDTTDEGGEILESIPEETSAEEQALLLQQQIELPDESALTDQLGQGDEGQHAGILEQQQQHEHDHQQQQQQQMHVQQMQLEEMPPPAAPEEEEESEPPCACPQCIENTDETGVFKGIDLTKAKCIICYITMDAPEHLIFRKPHTPPPQQQQQVLPTVEDVNNMETQIIDSGEEGTNVGPVYIEDGSIGTTEEVVIGIKSEAKEPEVITDEIDPHQQVQHHHHQQQHQLPSDLEGLVGEVQELHSHGQIGQDPLAQQEQHHHQHEHIALSEEATQRIHDVLTEKFGDEATLEDGQLNLDLVFKVLNCSDDDLDQDVDLLTNYIPICNPCLTMVNDAVQIYREIQKLEATLGGLRNNIKDQVAKSFDANFCKRKKENEEISGLVGQIDAARRAILGEDCPAIAKLLNYRRNGKKGRKGGRKKKQIVSRSALYPQVTLEAGKKRGRGGKGYDPNNGVKQEFSSDQEYEEYVNDDEQEEHEVIQTHSGRKVKKPNYKKWLLADEDDDYPEPGSLQPGVTAGEVKAEDVPEDLDAPASPKSEPDWSPGHSDEEFAEGGESETSSDSETADSDSDFDEDLDDDDDEYSERSAKKRRTSSGGNRIPCSECTRTFADDEKRDKHFERYHTPGGERHGKRHKGIKSYHCDHCEKVFKRTNLLRRHLEKEHGITPENGENSEKKKHVCEFCGQKYRNGSELRVHVRLHTGETPFKCDHCDQAFVSALKRETHIEQCHWEVPPLKCEFCDRAFFRQHRLRIHRITHTGERAYLCEICSQAFSHPTYLKYHQGQHAELNMESYKCKECGKQFANPTNLKLHVKTVHLKEFRFSCEVCGMGFTHMSHKRIHMRGHTGERPYKCEICAEAFRYKDRLRIHLRGHTGERPFICDVCKKGFASRSKLKRHEKIHEKNGAASRGEEPEPQRPLRYSCEDCGKAFAEPQHLSAHKRYCQRKNFGDKEDKPKAVKSQPGKIKATSTPAPATVTIAAPTSSAVVPAATVQKIQIEHIPAHSIQAQQAQMLVPVTYTYPVAYGYEVTQQYHAQQQQPSNNVRDYPNYN